MIKDPRDNSLRLEANDPEVDCQYGCLNIRLKQKHYRQDHECSYRAAH